MDWTNAQDVRIYHMFFDMLIANGYDAVGSHDQAVHMTNVWRAELVNPPVTEGE